MLKELFESLLPENIKDIPLMQDAIDIFVSNIEENSDLAIKIRDMFVSNNAVIKENLFKIYLSAIYNIILDLQKNQDFQNKLASANRPNALIYKNVEDILDYEFFTTSKTFKETKGTKGSIEYAYNFASRLEDAPQTGASFNLTPINPFNFRVDGNIFRETYEHVVKPMSHPIGFTYVYHRLIQNSLVDLFGIEFIYNVTDIEVRCLNGRFTVFTSDSTDANVKANFLTRINILTEQLFTPTEFDNQVTVYTNKVVKEFTKTPYDYGTYISILFTDNTILIQEPSPLKIYYRNYSDELNHTGNYITQYSSSCSLYLQYTESTNITTQDNQVFELDFYVGQVDDSGVSHALADIYYDIVDVENCFKVGGNTYNYTPGTDEGAATDTSSASYITYTIGELYDKTFASPDTYVNGVYTEGNDYSLDYTTIQNCEQFIDIGRSIKNINSEDNIIMTNSEQVLDAARIITIGSGGSYFTTDDTGLGTVNYAPYSGTVTYSYGEYVEENGIYYAMINSSTTVTGTSPSSDTSNIYWEKISSPEIGGYYIFSQDSQTYFTT